MGDSNQRQQQQQQQRIERGLICFVLGRIANEWVELIEKGEKGGGRAELAEIVY